MFVRIICALPALRAFLATPYPFLSKLSLLFGMVRAKRNIISATGFIEQLVMVTALLNSKVPGVVVECGTYQGGSAANLSRACELAGRKLYIFDSFDGLPEPSSEDRTHTVLITDEIHSYERGAWRGPYDLVKSNIGRFGCLDVCTFVKGYFETTLPKFSERVAFVFCDADLVDSVRTCLRYLWPLMSDGAIFFTHEAHHMTIGGLFFEEEWWRKVIASAPPGLVGAGSGIGLTPNAQGFLGSCIGYTVKNPLISSTSHELGVPERVVERNRAAV